MDCSPVNVLSNFYNRSYTIVRNEQWLLQEQHLPFGGLESRVMRLETRDRELHVSCSSLPDMV